MGIVYIGTQLGQTRCVYEAGFSDVSQVLYPGVRTDNMEGGRP